MNVTLTRLQRGSLLFLSASGYLAWFAGVGERGGAQGMSAVRSSSLTIAARASAPRIDAVIVRDPFAGAPTAAGAPPASARALADDAVPRASDDASVPDIGRFPAAARIADAAASTLVARATIVGNDPVAYVADGRTMEIVRVGDRLGERRIVAIDLRGIAFGDGTRLDLADAFAATPPPAAAAVPLAAKLDGLRRLVESRLPVAPPSVAAPLPPRSAVPEASARFPSPGPLPTVDRRGIPVGTNPTPDLTGPTPYPEPYPYPPAAPPHR